MATKVTLLCARCREPRVEQLPPDAISPHPGYVCEACGLRMSSSTMFFIYLITTILGLIFAGFFAYFLIYSSHGITKGI